MIRATRACINLETLKENLNSVRRSVPEGTAICAAVKANAYGHGVLRVAQALRDSGVEVLGVSSPFEGEELRNGGDRGRILLFGPTIPEEVPLTLTAELEPMVTGELYLDAIEEAVMNVSLTGPIRVHLKIDTGMGRVGCRPEEAVGLARRIAANPDMELAGTTTHFPSADSEDSDDIEFTRKQGRILEAAAQEIRAAGIHPGVIHAANSGGIALSPETSFGMVRPGIALYGYGPRLRSGQPLKPVMELKTRITAIKKINAGATVSYGRTWKSPRECWIATLPVGYADGYSRLLSNKAQVLINGTRYPVAGTVCMDQIMVDLGPDTDVKLYDEAVLFGPDTAGPDAEELAEIIGTISYEVTCGISARVPRIYAD
jgi:alanine racemase